VGSDFCFGEFTYGTAKCLLFIGERKIQSGLGNAARVLCGHTFIP
jgi:hypothetical protein